MTRKKAYHGIKKKIQESKKFANLKKLKNNDEIELSEVIDIPIPAKAPDADYQIILEHAIFDPKFRVHADLIKSAIKKAFKKAKIDLVVNYKSPRKKSFEITFMKSESEIIIWSGLDKGPPNRLKLPEINHVIGHLKKYIKK